MNLFGRKTGTDLTRQLRDDETKAARISRENAITARTQGEPVHGHDADTWDESAVTFQHAADDYQAQLNRKRH